MAFITKEEAEQLLPILQQVIASSGGLGSSPSLPSAASDPCASSSPSCSHTQTPQYAAGIGSSSASESSPQVYSLEHLLSRKKKNTKSSRAQSFLHVSLKCLLLNCTLYNVSSVYLPHISSVLASTPSGKLPKQWVYGTVHPTCKTYHQPRCQHSMRL